MIIKTRIFELCDGHYKNLSELAGAMGISVSQIYRVREGKRSINQSFIIGAIKAFPGCRLDDLFYFVPWGIGPDLQLSSEFNRRESSQRETREREHRASIGKVFVGTG